MGKAFPTQEIGSLKKPEWLLEVVRNASISDEDKGKARNDAAYLNIKTLEDIGLDIVYDGEVRRVEMYEYPVRYIEGFEFAGLVRSWDNKYYRKARCVSRVKYRTDFHLDEFKFVKDNSSRMVKVPVTGPYTLADWSYNEYYRNKEEFVIDLARNVVRPLMADLVKHGAKVIQIDEPAATTHQAEMKIFAEAMNECAKGIDAKVTIHACYSGNDYQALVPYATEIKASQFALEFANRDSWNFGVSDDARNGYSVLKSLKEHGYTGEIGLGVVDVHVDDLEPAELVRDRLLYAAKVLGDPAKVYANPDCGLRTRTRSIAFEKLRRVVRGAEMARQALS
jgi:5-methyltetrahydropteroyltriglutamate--homocysteine methyltransferase